MGTFGWTLLFSNLFLIFFAFLITAAEQAFQALSNARAEDLVEDNRRGAERVVSLVAHRYRTVEICQAARITVHALVAITLLLFFQVLRLPIWLAILFAMMVVMLITIFLEILIARPLGRYYPETTALLLAPLAELLRRAILPFSFLVRFLRRFGPQSPLTDAQLRAEMAEDLKEMVDEFKEEEKLEIEMEDRQILRSVFEMGITMVRELVVPRTEMLTVGIGSSLSDCLAVFTRSGFSRIPVIGEDSDDIRGVLYLKDVVNRIYNHPDKKEQPAHTLMREPHFVPEMMYADELLRQMQGSAPHLAIVVDEWGGTVGLVTFEDLLEELVGDVTDEHDHAEQIPIQLGPASWKVPARWNIEELGELFDLQVEDEDVDTAGGLLAKALGKVPIVGDSAEVQGMILEVESVSGRRKQMAWLKASLSEEKNNE